LQVFSRIHSFAGVTAMYTHEKLINSTVVSSVGRDGHHRYWNICTESQTAIQIRCEILPTKWPFIITYSNIHGLLICGFKEVRCLSLDNLHNLLFIVLCTRTI